MTDTRKYLEHTADILFQAQATTLAGLFEQCGFAVEESMTNLSQLDESEEREITGKNTKIDRLLFDFLDDLLFYKDSDLIIFKRFEIKISESKNEQGQIEYSLHCKAYGEPLQEGKHERIVDVKAITMHMFEVKKTDTGFWAQVLIDI